MKWIKLLRIYDGKPVGEIVEVEEAVARALVAGGVAEDATGTAEGVLAATQTAELRAQLSEITRSIADGFRASTAEIRAARPDLGRVDPAASEDDKKFPTGGYRSLGHYAHEVFRAQHRGSPDPQSQTRLGDWFALNERVQRGLLERAAATGMSENIDPDGGAAIPIEFSQRIWERSRSQMNLLDKVGLMPISGNTLVVPADAESSRVDGSRSGGVLGYWEGEADQYTKSKPTLRKVELKLKKLTLLCYMTNELLEDSGGALDSYLTRKAAEELVFKGNDALINGTGAGMPLGALKAACKVTLTAESGQGAGTVVPKNIIKMWARLYAPCRPNAAWYLNQDVEQQVQQLTLATGTYSGQLVYMPPTGLSESPYASLQGRPVIPIEQCPTIGTEGDIILADFSQYLGIRKSSGMQQAVSMHLRFDYDETVFKFTLRVDAQPAWQSALTPYKGSNTQSPIITLNSTRT